MAVNKIIRRQAERLGWEYRCKLRCLSNDLVLMRKPISYSYSKTWGTYTVFAAIKKGKHTHSNHLSYLRKMILKSCRHTGLLELSSLVRVMVILTSSPFLVLTWSSVTSSWSRIGRKRTIPSKALTVPITFSWE